MRLGLQRPRAQPVGGPNRNAFIPPRPSSLLSNEDQTSSINHESRQLSDLQQNTAKPDAEEQVHPQTHIKRQEHDPSLFASNLPATTEQQHKDDQYSENTDKCALEPSLPLRAATWPSLTVNQMPNEEAAAPVSKKLTRRRGRNVMDLVSRLNKS